MIISELEFTSKVKETLSPLKGKYKFVTGLVDPVVFASYTKQCNSVGMMYIVNKLFHIVGYTIDSMSGFKCEDYARLRFVPQEIETMVDELTEYLADQQQNRF